MNFLLSPPFGASHGPKSFRSPIVFTLTSCITDAFNCTLGSRHKIILAIENRYIFQYSGHTDSWSGLGIIPPRQIINESYGGGSIEVTEDVADDEEQNEEGIGEIDEEDEVGSDITNDEMKRALENALRIGNMSHEEVCALQGLDGGWKLVHRDGDSFCLYKRRLNSGHVNETSDTVAISNQQGSRSGKPFRRSLATLFPPRRRQRRVDLVSSTEELIQEPSSPASASASGSASGAGTGPVQYLMTGMCDDVSPRTFLHAQVFDPSLSSSLLSEPSMVSPRAKHL